MKFWVVCLLIIAAILIGFSLVVLGDVLGLNIFQRASSFGISPRLVG